MHGLFFWFLKKSRVYGKLSRIAGEQTSAALLLVPAHTSLPALETSGNFPIINIQDSLRSSN